MLVLVGSCWVGCALDYDALQRPDEGPVTVGDPVVGADPTAPSDGGVTLVEPPDPVDPTRDCGLVGLPCCERTACETGACLRGTCAGFGGSHGVAPSCAPSSCRSRNPYTAGCSCPAGFDETPVMSVLSECGGASSPTVVTLCTAARMGAPSDWAGAWLRTDGAGACAGACAAPNPYTGDCACPGGTMAIETRVHAPSSCGEQPATFAFCLSPAAPTTTFAGAYQRSATGCAIDNPLTGECRCPDGATAHVLPASPQPIHVCTR